MVQYSMHVLFGLTKSKLNSMHVSDRYDEWPAEILTIKFLKKT